MDTRFQAGDRCMVVKGVNAGAWVTLLDYCEPAGGWLFDEAYPPLQIEGEGYRHSLEAAEGVLLTIAEAELQSAEEHHLQLLAAVDAVLSRHAMYRAPRLHVLGSRSYWNICPAGDLQFAQCRVAAGGVALNAQVGYLDQRI